MLTHILCLFPPQLCHRGQVSYFTLYTSSSSSSFRPIYHQRNYFIMCMSSPWNIWLLCWRVSRIQFSLFSASGYLPRTTLPFPRTQNRHGTTWLLSKCLNVFIIPVSWFLHNGCDLLPDTSDRAHLPKHDGIIWSLLWKGSQFSISTNFTLLKALLSVCSKKNSSYFLIGLPLCCKATHQTISS